MIEVSKMQRMKNHRQKKQIDLYFLDLSAAEELG